MNQKQYINKILSDANINRIINYVVNINDIHDNHRPKMVNVVFKELISHIKTYQMDRIQFEEDDIERTNDFIIKHKSEEIIFNTINPNVKTKKSYVMPTVNIKKYNGYDFDEDDGIHDSYGPTQMKIYSSKDKKWSRIHFN